jgi:hypothetical protein
MNDTLQLFSQLYDWLGVKCKGQDPCSFSKFKWIGLLSAFHWMTGESVPVGLVPQFTEYLKERRIMDVLDKKGAPRSGGSNTPVFGRHSLTSNGHVYCPEDACEYPTHTEQDGATYCCGCTAYIGNAECEERVLSILVKELDGTLKRVVL